MARCLPYSFSLARHGHGERIQLFITKRKEDTKSESIILRIWMCCPQGGEAITQGIMSSRNLRQTVLRRRKREPEPRQVVLRRRKCKRNPRHIILRGRKCKRNLRHTILRRRKCKRKPRRFIIRRRKCEPKPGHVIIRGWMGQTESRAGRHPAEDGMVDFRASLYGGEMGTIHFLLTIQNL